MKVQYLHETERPVFYPAQGDIRIIPTVSNTDKGSVVKFDVAKCIELKDHHIIYKYLNKEDSAIAIPYEVISDWGFVSIDEAIKNILNGFMDEIIKWSKTRNSEYRMKSDIPEYYEKLAQLTNLSKQVLKEADKVKKLLVATYNF